MLAPHAPAPYVQHDDLLGYDALRAEARKAVDESGKPQKDIADELGVTPPAVSKALQGDAERPGRYADLQRRIIEHLTPFRVSSEPTFRVSLKAEGQA